MGDVTLIFLWEDQTGRLGARVRAQLTTATSCVVLRLIAARLGPRSERSSLPILVTLIVIHAVARSRTPAKTGTIAKLGSQILQHMHVQMF